MTQFLEMMKSFNLDAIDLDSFDYFRNKEDVNRMIGNCQYANAGNFVHVFAKIIK
jgi:hypothetical protein